MCTLKCALAFHQNKWVHFLEKNWARSGRCPSLTHLSTLLKMSTCLSPRKMGSFSWKELGQERKMSFLHTSVHPPSHICPPSFTHLRILEGLEAKPSYVIHQGCGISPAFLSQGGREVQRISFLSHSLSPFHLDHPGPQACSCCRCTHKNQIMPHFLGFPQIREWQSLEEAGKGSEMGLLISVSMTFWSKSVGQSEV